MAYVFNRTLNLLGGNNQPDKQDIFNTQPQQSQETEQPTSYNPQIKQNIEGAISTQTPNSSAGSKQSFDRTSLVAPKSAVLKANLGKAQAPKMAGQALEGIKQAGQNLQSEADSYLSGAKTYAAPDKTKIQSAYKKGGQDYTDLASFLNEDVSSASETFQPKTKAQVDQAAYLTTPQGVQGAMQREADPEYTRGMGSLDMSLLGQSPGFQQTLEAIRRGQEQLNTETSTDAQNKLNEERLRKEKESLGIAQGLARDALQGEVGGVESRARAEADKYTKKMNYYAGKYKPTAQEKASWDAELSSYLKSQASAASGDLGDVYRGFDYSPYINKKTIAEVDPRKYLDINNQSADYTDFLKQDEANQFNSIMSLLGKGDMTTAGQGPSDMYGFDQEAYIKSILDKARASKAQEVAVQEWKDKGGLEQGFAETNFPKNNIIKKDALTTVPGSLALPNPDEVIVNRGGSPKIKPAEIIEPTSDPLSTIGQTIIPSFKTAAPKAAAKVPAKTTAQTIAEKKKQAQQQQRGRIR